MREIFTRCTSIEEADEIGRFIRSNLNMRTDLEGCGLTKEWIEECGKQTLGSILFLDNPELLNND